MLEKITALAQIRTRCADGTARTIREHANLPAAALAEQIGVPLSTLYRWERGENLPNGDEALRYLIALDSVRTR